MIMNKNILTRPTTLAVELLAAGALLSSCDQDKTVSQQNEKLNILCITCEDISPYLGCYGDEVAKTPVLDQLAKEGVLFTNAFATVGVCAPARASLITGMYPTAIGASNMRTSANYLDGVPPYEAVPPAEVKCFTEYMRAAGFFCTNNVKTDYQFNSPITAWDQCSQKAHWRNRPEGMPFFSIFNIASSHESRLFNVRATEPLAIDPEWVEVPPYYPDHPIVRRDIARMHTNNTIMDREVGELIDQLKEDGLLDKTIIIFYSDHGGPMPRHKRMCNDLGLKVPMIIRFPHKEYAGTNYNELVSFVDIPATILSLANIDVPEYMHGRPFWGSQKAEPREYIFGARDRMDRHVDCRRSVRDKQFLYIRNYMPQVSCYQDIQFRKNIPTMRLLLEMKEDGKLNSEQMYWFREEKKEEELYDTRKDPYQLHNLAGDPEYKGQLVKMREVHEAWQERTNDPGPVPEKELVESMWPGMVQPVTEKPEFNKQDGKVAITCSTEGASIAYQVNGEGYTKDHWCLYHEPVELDEGDNITAVAIRIGYKQSQEATFGY